MPLPLQPPFPPMEALLVKEAPVGPQWHYEPKWDGFRCLIFRDGPTVELQSKSGQPLTRYFPEVADAVLSIKAPRFVLDSELVVPINGVLVFDQLLQRIHPAASRIAKLAKEFPALVLVFDILADEKGDLLIEEPLKTRRAHLQNFAKKYLRNTKQIRLSPATIDVDIATGWLRSSGGALDGIIAKRIDLAYQSGERSGAQKIKLRRSADCVVGGFRYASKAKVVGSLLLGLFNEQGLLDHVGFCSGLNAEQKKELTPQLKALIKPPGFTGNKPGGPSRWSTKRSGEWEPLSTKLVVEVQYDQFTAGRFRHGTKFLRWRPDKSPKQCSIKQVQHESRVSVLDIL